MARDRISFSVWFDLGMRKASITFPYAAESRSMAVVNLSRYREASLATDFISSSTSSYPFLPMVKFATISTRLAAAAAAMAETLPPPGTGSLEAVLSRKYFTFRSLNN